MILGILQARTSSSRLPNKVLKPILGQPMLIRQIERLKRVKTIDQLLVATSTQVSDDAIATLCNEHNLACFRGSLEDVLDRFYQAAKTYEPAYVVRLTADCPLADPSLIDDIVNFGLQGNYDYVSNTLEPTFPDGLDVEVVRYSCLVEAWREAKLPSQREHVTPFIHQQSPRYTLGSFKNHLDLSSLRWTVDMPEDFELVQHIYAALYPANSNFTTQDILTYLEKHPELKTYNTHYQRNEGMLKSLLADKKQDKQYDESL